MSKAKAKKTVKSEATKAPKAEKAQKQKKVKADGKLSAIDAAAKVLGDAKEPLNTKQMIEQTAAKGLWKSANGQTPPATLYSAILREIQKKGKESRFKKADKGLFAING